MKLTLLAVSALSSLARLACAENCNKGYYYCGKTLLGMGNYYAQVINALESRNILGDPDHVQDTLFYCEGGDNGDIIVSRACSNGCDDNGAGYDDSCTS